jgi:hypothetical protein
MNLKKRPSFPIQLLLSFFLVLTTVSPAFANFFRGGNLGVGARAMGMSGAFSALADDPSAAYWNPAGLALLDRPEILGMLGSYFNDKNRNVYFSFQYPLPNDIHLAISTNNLFYSDVAGAREDQYTGSIAIPLNVLTDKRLLVGANFRYLLAELGPGNGTAQGAGVDLGILFRQPFKDSTEFRAALVLTDISTALRYDSTGVEQSVPPVLTSGLAYKFDPFTSISADLPWTISDDPLLNGQNLRVRVGAEHWFFDGKLGVRAGFTSFLTLPGDFSAGASYRASTWSLDYAYMNHSENLGNSHRLSGSYWFDSETAGKPEPRPYMVQSLVGDEKIYLKWEIPEGSQADGYLVYIRSDEEKDFQRAKQQLLQTKYCLLRGAKNGLRYHVFIRSVVDGKEKYSCSEWVASPRLMSENAKPFYENGMKYFGENKLTQALYSARKAEELDPNNYDIKNLIRKLETSHHEGLVPEEDKK